MSIMWNLAITKNKPLSHYEALAKAIYNPAYSRFPHRVIADKSEAIHNPAYIKLYKTLQFQTFKIPL
ncbi:hypothetical protein [Helicobacter rodentium]|uniref:hypothetical protein n=1 Tax=Helicobacter rodentium TaxID=59617 RepID=UPI00047CB8E1|nr:hypothetical protein [Helicobacter rodentium]